MKEVFETWRMENRRFLAVPDYGRDGVVILDSHGANYGAWSSVLSFKKTPRDKRQPLGGSVRLSANLYLS